MDLDLEKRLQGHMLGIKVDPSPGVGPLTIASDDLDSELTQFFFSACKVGRDLTFSLLI